MKIFADEFNMAHFPTTVLYCWIVWIVWWGTKCRANAKYEITAPHHTHSHTAHIHVTWENFSPFGWWCRTDGWSRGNHHLTFVGLRSFLALPSDPIRTKSSSASIPHTEAAALGGWWNFNHHSHPPRRTGSLNFAIGLLCTYSISVYDGNGKSVHRKR